MAKLRLIYFEGCPNAEKVRQNLSAAGYPFEVVRQDDLPAQHPLKTYSSPTILKDNEIIFGAATGSTQGGCSLEIPSAGELRGRIGGKIARGSAGLLSQVGAIASALTVGFCPVCIPALGALLSAVGLGFLVQETVLKPVLLLFLMMTVGGLLWSYLKEHHRIAPLLLGAVMAVGLYMSRYVYLGSKANAVLMWVSMAGIIAASLWNLKLRRARSCPICVDESSATKEEIGE